MSEMVERVARALVGPDWDDVRNHADGRFRAHWLDRARAAIEAMREPTETMLAAAEKAIPFGDAPFIWEAMIAAAVAEPPRHSWRAPDGTLFVGSGPTGPHGVLRLPGEKG